MAGAIDLSTTYLGLRLSSPFIAGASPLADHLDTARRLEDAGCAAIVLHSLFEEQVEQDVSGRIRQLDPSDPRFADIMSWFPEPRAFALGPDEYLEHLRAVKAAVGIPVIASLNGASSGWWARFAEPIAQAGADALELNMYEVVTDGGQSGIAVEYDLRQAVRDVSQSVPIPVAVKLSPFFTAFANLARALEANGAKGLVIFNRFLQPDIDTRHLAVWPRLELSTSAELLLRLRWLAILRGQVACSLAATGGVATSNDAIKTILAGADAVQLVSAILRNGPSYFKVLREELVRWMEAMELERLDQVRGRLSLWHNGSTDAYERAQYLRTLSGWSTWLGYAAYERAHDDEIVVPS